MAGEPLGTGEQNHPKNGNAILYTISTSGQKITTPLWINQFSTGVNIQIDSAQLHDRLSHRPVRFSERYLQFNTIWNVKDRPKYINLGKTIKDHWIANFNQVGQCSPMTLHYFGASKSWKGFIENFDASFANTDVVLNYPFRMRLLIDTTKENEMSEITGKGPYLPTQEGYAPTARDAQDWGTDWYDKALLLKGVKVQLRDFKKYINDPVNGYVKLDANGNEYAVGYQRPDATQEQ